MKINMNQSEIEKALTGHLKAQGIAVDGKAISLDFKAGRKAAGLSVNISIEDSDLPDLPIADEDKPKLAVVKSIELKSTPDVTQDDAPETPNQPDSAVVTDVPGEVSDEPKKTVSLFGNN